MLATARRTPRPMRPNDRPVHASVVAAPRSVHGGGPFGPRAALGPFCHDAAGWPPFGLDAPMLAAAGAKAGPVGIGQGPRFPETAHGWPLRDGAEGRVFAAEAATAARGHAFAALGWVSGVSDSDAGNARAVTHAERPGALRDPAAAGPGEAPCRVHRHPGPAA